MKPGSAAGRLAAILIPGGLLAWAAWAGRGQIMTAVGYAVRSAYSGNFGGVRSAPVDQIVIHTTGKGTAEAALSWFAMPHGAAGPTSAHYVVAKDGTVTRAVEEDHVAWHAGERQVNGRSIGIECEGMPDDPSTWTPALLGALVGLCADLSRRYRVPVVHAAWTDPGYFGHMEIPAAAAVGKVDPGPHFPWDDFLLRVAQRAGGIA